MRGDLWEYDVVERELTSSSGVEQRDVVPDAERVVPYAYVMQHLVAEIGAR